MFTSSSRYNKSVSPAFRSSFHSHTPDCDRSTRPLPWKQGIDSEFYERKQVALSLLEEKVRWKPWLIPEYEKVFNRIFLTLGGPWRCRAPPLAAKPAHKLPWWGMGATHWSLAAHSLSTPCSSTFLLTHWLFCLDMANQLHLPSWLIGGWSSRCRRSSHAELFPRESGSDFFPPAQQKPLLFALLKSQWLFIISLLP